VRFLFALMLLLAIALGGVFASSSCVIDVRDPDGGADADVGVPDAGDAEADAEAGIDLDCGCCNQAVLPSLPSCTGQVAFAFPAGDCKVPCSGPVAYALCEGTCYTACGCDLPAGYTLFDAGYVIGPGDAGKDGQGDESPEGGEAGRDGSVDTGAGDAPGG
jgi:hypothetical protein